MLCNREFAPFVVLHYLSNRKDITLLTSLANRALILNLMIMLLKPGLWKQVGENRDTCFII